LQARDGIERLRDIAKKCQPPRADSQMKLNGRIRKALEDQQRDLKEILADH